MRNSSNVRDYRRKNISEYVDQIESASGFDQKQRSTVATPFLNRSASQSPGFQPPSVSISVTTFAASASSDSLWRA
jgi:hypothetical protein